MEIEIKSKRYGCLSVAMWMILVFCLGMIMINFGL